MNYNEKYVLANKYPIRESYVDTVCLDFKTKKIM